MEFPGKNTGVGCHFLLQGIFLTQGSNLSLLHWQAVFLFFFFFLPLSHQGSPETSLALQVDSLSPEKPHLGAGLQHKQALASLSLGGLSYEIPPTSTHHPPRVIAKDGAGGGGSYPRST